MALSTFAFGGAWEFLTSAVRGSIGHDARAREERRVRVGWVNCGAGGGGGGVGRAVAGLVGAVGLVPM